MPDPRNQLAQLDESLTDFGGADAVPANLGDVFNALLAEAKEERGEDPVVAAIDPVGKTFEGSDFADIEVRSLRALVAQLLTALES
ncbi:MAG TPA: hypothetical protein VGG40_02240 [Solirubrobacterales bacterium]|jgi:hypothetical protein